MPVLPFTVQLLPLGDEPEADGCGRAVLGDVGAGRPLGFKGSKPQHFSGPYGLELDYSRVRNYCNVSERGKCLRQE